MITATTNTTQTYNYSHQTSKKTSESNFEESLQNEQTLEAQKTKTEEVRFKMIERMSFEYIKNVDKEKIDEIYNDLPKEEKNKIVFLRSIANLSENSTLNKVLFDEAKNMTPNETKWFFFGKAGEMSKYKMTGEGQRYLVNKHTYIHDDNGKVIVNKDINPPHPEEYKLSHEEAFNFLLDMLNSSKEGMEKYKDELQELYTETYDEYSNLLEKYNNELRRNITGTI